MVLTCKKCGSINIKKEIHDLGYTTAEELGRPRGAKGQDVCGSLNVCQDCGSVLIEMAPAPCFICGGKPETYVDGVDLSAEVTNGAIQDFVPGFPSEFNCCGNPACLKKLEEKALSVIMQAVDKGRYE